MKLISFLAAAVLGSLYFAGASKALPSDLHELIASPMFTRGASLYQRADSQAATDIITALKETSALSVTLDKTVKAVTDANVSQEGVKVPSQIQDVTQRMVKELNSQSSSQSLSDADADSVTEAFTSFSQTHSTTLDDLVAKAPVLGPSSVAGRPYAAPIYAALEQNEKAFDEFVYKIVSLVPSSQATTIKAKAGEVRQAFDRAFGAYHA